MSWLRSSQMRRTYLARSPSTRCHVAQWCYATRRSSMPEGTKERKKEKKTRLVFHQMTLGLPRLAKDKHNLASNARGKSVGIPSFDRSPHIRTGGGRAARPLSALSSPWPTTSTSTPRSRSSPPTSTHSTLSVDARAYRPPMPAITTTRQVHTRKRRLLLKRSSLSLFRLQYLRSLTKKSLGTNVRDVEQSAFLCRL
jgi:hypothetical protein